METEAMGRVLTEATIENLGDLVEVERGLRSPDQIRRITVSDALVDTGSTTLALPTRLIKQLGLTKRYEKRATSAASVKQVSVYEPVRLTLQGRECSLDVMQVHEEPSVLVGQIPLVMLDLVVDLQGRRLIGNPAHGGEQILELY